jgi:hypothetical protein
MDSASSGGFAQPLVEPLIATVLDTEIRHSLTPVLAYALGGLS